MAEFDSKFLPLNPISTEERKEIRLLAKCVKEFDLRVYQQWKGEDGIVKTVTGWWVPPYTDEPALGGSKHRPYTEKGTGRVGYLWNQPNATQANTVIVLSLGDRKKPGERLKPSEFLKWVKESKAEPCGVAPKNPLPITHEMVQQRLQALRKEDEGKPVEWEKGANKDV